MHAKVDMPIATTHINHHIDVNNDMTLKKINEKDYTKNNIFMTWNETLFIFIFGFSSALALNK